MPPLRYSINVTLDGCCDHRAIPADEDLHRHAIDNLEQADALLFGRVIYEMMEAAWRPPAQAVARPDWMEPFARTKRRVCHSCPCHKAQPPPTARAGGFQTAHADHLSTLIGQIPTIGTSHLATPPTGQLIIRLISQDRCSPVLG